MCTLGATASLITGLQQLVKSVFISGKILEYSFHRTFLPQKVDLQLATQFRVHEYR